MVGVLFFDDRLVKKRARHFWRNLINNHFNIS